MKVCVIGAGITGLALTHYFDEFDVDVITFEARAEPGGVIRSGQIDGRILEYGPQRIRLTPELSAMVSGLGLGDSLLTADDDLPLYVYSEGELREVPRSISALFRTDLLTVRGKLRILAEPLTASGRPDECVADLFTRKFGSEVYRNLIEPLFGGIYGSDPAAMPAEYALAELLTLEAESGSLLRGVVDRMIRAEDLPPSVSFTAGVQMLPDALYERHRSAIHLNSPVDTIEKSPDDDGFVVDGGSRSVTVDEVVITVPAGAAAALLGGLAGATCRPLRGLTYNSLAIVHLHADSNATGVGYQVRRDEPLETLGVTWNDALFDRDGIYTAFLGGMKDPTVKDRPSEELGTVAQREFRRVMGVDATVVDVQKLPYVIPAYDMSWNRLRELTIPDGITLATNYTARIGVPGRVREAKSVAERLAKNTD